MTISMVSHAVKEELKKQGISKAILTQDVLNKQDTMHLIASQIEKTQQSVASQI